ncbi:MAG: glycine--tRNA ligase subunit beta [Ramlibacter sp.]|nr:glycine--tRNA ligase subunit beta [Ramlibacter sp.]
MAHQNLLVELFVEELPPKALRKLGQAFAGVLFEQLKAQGLASGESKLTSFASPRRLGAHITVVATHGADQAVSQKLMPVSVGLDASGNATPALLKKLQSLGADASAVAGLKRAMDGKAEALFYDSTVKGATLAEGLQKALNESLAKLPIPKVMTYQLADGWSDVKFVRPAHSLVAMHGSGVIPVEVLGLKAGNTTRGHRFEAPADPVRLKDADSYESALEQDGAVIASFEARRAEIVRQLTDAAARVGSARVIEDEALLDEVTALVERPNVLVCEFEKEFLEVPQECLILTMKANQKYFPLLDAAGKLTNKFLVVSNIRPADPSAVIGGNERVVRPRLADAKFFFDQDRRTTLASRVPGLTKVVYHNKLGTQFDRMQRVRWIGEAIANRLNAGLVANVQFAAEFAKTDLLTGMVGEFPELQGIMGRYYALNDKLPTEVADAIEDHYKPRFAGDELPRADVGLIVALADKLETLAGLFSIGQKPTGDKDPFALRRHALGVVRILMERDLPLDLGVLVDAAVREVKGLRAADAPWPLANDASEVRQLEDFIYERLAGSLREQGYSAQEVDAVLALRPQRLGDVAKRLAAVRAFAALPEAPALAAANKRIGNILKKAEKADAHVSEGLLKEEAEKALYAMTRKIAPQAGAQFEAGDFTGSLQTLAALRATVDAFFDGVMVNAEEADLRLNRLGLLATLHQAMNRIADLSRLAQ